MMDKTGNPMEDVVSNGQITEYQPPKNNLSTWDESIPDNCQKPKQAAIKDTVSGWRKCNVVGVGINL